MARMRFTKWDLIPIAAVATLAIVVFLLFLPSKAPADRVEIYKDGVLVRTLLLQEDTTVTITGEYTNVITVRDGKVAVTDSDCPGGDCMACGWRNTAGGSIVCLPNGLEIRVICGETDVDMVVG